MTANKRGYCGIGLDNPKNNLNVGSVMRASGCYDASFVAYTGKRLGSSITDTMKTYRHKPLFRVEDLKSVIPYDCVPVAVDMIEGATPLQEYKHPERAFYIFGAEDATLGERVTSWCRDTIYVPTNRCMNLAATVNVVLYDRMAKQLTKPPLLVMPKQKLRDYQVAAMERLGIKSIVESPTGAGKGILDEAHFKICKEELWRFQQSGRAKRKKPAIPLGNFIDDK